MNKTGLWLALLVGSIVPASAQVTVEVLQDQDQFLAGEKLAVAARITNLSGQTLHLGGEEGWLTFSVESREGAPVIKSGDVPVKGEFQLDSSKMATVRVDLAPYFSMGQPGRYAILATVRIPEWKREINSRPKNFDLVEGNKLWEQEFGIPPAAGSTNSTPEVRKYTLQQARYLRNQLRLYLRVTDPATGKIFRVVPVGALVSFSEPEPQVDKWSNLHVLYQNGPHTYSYSVFTPDGEAATRQTYDFSGNRPKLQADADGKISVNGGVRRVAAEDQPKTKPLTPPNDSPPPKQ
jgi:hypothetical protein